MPDFRRNDQHGNIVQLYRDLHAGQPLLFLLLPQQARSDAGARAICQALSDDRRDLELVALVRGGLEHVTELAGDLTLEYRVLADDGSLLTLFGGEPGTGVAAVLCDRGLRMLRTFHADTPDAFSASLDEARRLLAEPEAASVAGPAPVLVVPRILDDAFCAELIAEFERQGGEPSGIYVFEQGERKWMPDPNVKDRRDVYIRGGALFQRIQQQLARRLLPEIQRAFHYRVERHEPFKLICYEASTGGYFRPHRDNVSRDAWFRRFAMTINLNTGDYAGGQLRFPEYGPHLYQPPRGGAVVFSCSLVHEALPVTRGKRYALLTFFFDDAAERAAMEAGGSGAPD